MPPKSKKAAPAKKTAKKALTPATVDSSDEEAMVVEEPKTPTKTRPAPKPKTPVTKGKKRGVDSDDELAIKASPTKRQTTGRTATPAKPTKQATNKKKPETIVVHDSDDSDQASDTSMPEVKDLFKDDKTPKKSAPKGKPAKPATPQAKPLSKPGRSSPSKTGLTPSVRNLRVEPESPSPTKRRITKRSPDPLVDDEAEEAEESDVDGDDAEATTADDASSNRDPKDLDSDDTKEEGDDDDDEQNEDNDEGEDDGDEGESVSDFVVEDDDEDEEDEEKKPKNQKKATKSAKADKPSKKAADTADDSDNESVVYQEDYDKEQVQYTKVIVPKGKQYRINKSEKDKYLTYDNMEPIPNTIAADTFFTEDPNMGWTVFSANFGDKFPKYDWSTTINFIQFTRFENHINVARCWAKRLVWKSVTVKRVTREFLCLGDIQAALPASCYDVGMVSEIRFSQYKVTKTGLSQKAISTVPLVIEADLRTIKLGVTLGVERFAAQYKGNAWEYATKMATLETPSTTPHKKGTPLFKIPKHATTGVSDTNSKYVLDPTDTIPVYDLTTGKKKTTFDFPKDLRTAHNKFPRWPNTEPPVGSLVVVKYTVSRYTDKKDKLNVSFNLQWVGVLHGDPEVINPSFYWHDDPSSAVAGDEDDWEARS